jgi:hypothetical protein
MGVSAAVAALAAIVAGVMIPGRGAPVATRRRRTTMRRRAPGGAPT